MLNSRRYPHPLPNITEDILKRALELCPELVPEEIRAARAPRVEDLKPLIIEEGCGLRPARTNGIRLESVQMEKRDGSKTPVVFNYGYVTSRNVKHLLMPFIGQTWWIRVSKFLGLGKDCGRSPCCCTEGSLHNSLKMG